MEDPVAAALKEMGLSEAPIRTVLIQEGYFVGHKYRFDDGYAIVLAGGKVIEVYDKGGKLLRTVNLETKDAAA